MQKIHTLDEKGKFEKKSAMFIARVLTNNDSDEMKIAEEIIDNCVGISVPDDA